MVLFLIAHQFATMGLLAELHLLSGSFCSVLIGEIGLTYGYGDGCTNGYYFCVFVVVVFSRLNLAAH